MISIGLGLSSMRRRGTAPPAAQELVGPGRMSGPTFARAGPASYLDGSGDPPPVTVAASVPRYQGAAQRLLIEGARTNLLLNSAAAATQTVTVAAQAHTLSFFGPGSVTLSGASTAGPVVGSGANVLSRLTFTPTAGALTLTATGQVLFAQLEAAGSPSSWMATTDAAATRAADFVTWLPPAGYAQAGTILMKLMLPQPSPSGGDQYLLGIDAGAVGNSRNLYRQNNSNNISGRVQVGGVNTGITASGSIVPGVPFAAGLTYDTSGTEILVSGGVSRAVAAAPAGANIIRIGGYAVVGSSMAFGEYETVLAYPYRMGSAELASRLAAL